MMPCLTVCLVFIIWILNGLIHKQFACGGDVNSSQDYEHWQKLPLTFAWIFKPPYATPPSNESLDNEAQGLMRDAVLKHIAVECGYSVKKHFDIKTLEMENEFAMLELLRQNKVHIALPIFEHPSNRRYPEFPFFKLDDYPGTEYITVQDDSSTLTVVLDSVIKAWPLLAVTMVLTAIAGIIMWALDTYWNSEEFPRSFIKGSWDGFWWSFISMTTVGYGDKSPKSIVARIFSIIWIMMGLITMAIFTANVTSALTAASLELTPNTLNGAKIGVLNNGTEFEHALSEGANPKVYKKIEGCIEALNSKQIDGMLLDHYTASYYQARDKLKSLVIVTKFELRRDVGLLFSNDRKELAACLNFYRSNIWRLTQTITSTYKLNKQKPTKNFSLFDDSRLLIKHFLFISLGVLGTLLLVGTVWEFLFRKKDKIKGKVELGVVNSSMSTEQEVIRCDMQDTRALLKQIEEQLNNMEAKFSKFQFCR
ncbi:uncharacterized protein LOC114971148 [Acropora millepora]|uniref:uncharacterized protein LOC114971148 n=1 Tax=Acropora millepora TaxID=45264 RepID=UPI001CF13202|nr:uncharacterized protein LOC114971148 [Acropora millepora]